MTRAFLIPFLALLSLGILRAQDVPTLLPELIVVGKTEPFHNESTSSLYGFEIDWLEAPRSVTTFTTEEFHTGTVSGVRDFNKLYATGFSKTNFGSPAHPSIRGLPADVFVDGLRQGLRSFGNGMPLDFNPYSAVHVIKGIPTPALGTQQYVSGYVDLQRKMPDFGHAAGEAGFTYGSFDTKIYNLEYQAPITDTLAYLFSTEIENSGSYYDNGFKDSEAFYLALAYRDPAERYFANFSVDYYHANYTENFGLNRPTQDLIDSGLYQSGSVTDANGDGISNNADVFGAFNTIDLGPQVPISRDRRLLAGGDQAEGQHVNVRLDQTYEATDNWTLRNKTSYRWVDRELLSSYYYSEIINDSFAIENRLTSEWDHPSPFYSERDATLLTGLGFRYQHVNAINDYFNEPANAWDLSSGAPINYVNQLASGSIPIAGRPGYFGTPGIFNAETNDSDAFTISPFFHWRLPLSEVTTFDFGGGYDRLNVDYQDPLADFTDEYTAYLPSLTASISQELSPNLTGYFTASYAHSTAIANGGGYSVPSPDGFTYDYFHRKNYNYELGLKGRLNDASTFSLAGFVLERNEGLLGAFNDEFSTKGIELEIFTEISERAYLNFTYAYLDSRLKNQSPFVISGSPVDSFGADGTPGFVTPSFAVLPQGDYREPGLPQNILNLRGGVEITDNFSISSGINFTSEMNNNYSGTLVIPSQHWMDLTFSYDVDKWSAWFTILNVTDQENFSPPNPIFGNDSIVAEWPIHFRGGFSVRF